MRKRIIAFAAALTSVFLLTSCGGIKITELNERLIIEAVGVDFSEDGGYTVTVQALNSASPAGNAQSDGNTELTENLVFKGSSVGEALNGISVHTGKTPLFSQARVLIIGFDTAKKNISKALDFFLREYTTRTDILVAVSEGSATEMLSASFGENAIGASVIENALNSGESTGNTVGLPLYKFVNLLLDNKSGAYCPVIGTQKEELSENFGIKIIGTALFSENKLNGVIDSNKTCGLLYLIDRVSSADIPIEADCGVFTLRVVDSRTKIKPPENGGSTFLIRINTECDIVEFESADFSKLTKEAVEKVRIACEEHIKDRAGRAITSTYYESDCDVCRFARRMWLSDPERYRAAANEDGSFSEKFAVEIDVGVKIRRTGKETLYEE